MRTLVTGGAGFIGSHIVDALVERGDEVTVVDDLSRGLKERVNSSASFVQIDITNADLRDVFGKVKPEVVFHHAAQIDVRRSVREPLFDTNTNVVGTVNVLQAAADAATKRVIFASSGGTVYGDTEKLPVAEDHPCHPASNYGAAKVCGEIYGNTFTQMYGLEFASLRYANVYGPRQDPHGEAGVVAIFAQKLLAGDAAVVNGDGLQTRDYVYVGDVVAANLAAIDAKPGAYNIGTGVETNVNEIYAAVAAACGVPGEPQHGPAKPGEQLRSCLAIGLAAAELGWHPTVDLRTGIGLTVDFFRNLTEGAA